jgi:hypothetical protein
MKNKTKKRRDKMRREEKVEKIEELIKEMSLIQGITSDSEQFIKWRKRSILVISKVFGDKSKQLCDFQNIIFWSMVSVSDDIKNKTLKIDAYNRGLTDAKVQLELMIEELNEFYEESQEYDVEDENNLDKIFISHASADKEYTDLLVQLLNDMGIEKSQNKILYSSKHGYGIPLVENIYDYLKQELNKNILMVFVLSENYYNSVACLNEMGAAWVNTKAHYSILLPNFSFNKVEGAIDPLEISFKMNDKHRLTEFKNNITQYFNLKNIDARIWEEDRDKFINEVEKLILRDRYKNSLNRVDIGKIKNKQNGNFEIELRFINQGGSPIECQELNIQLIDEEDNSVEISVPNDFLEGRFIYPHENRREVIILNNPKEQFKITRVKKWHTNSYWTTP